MSSTYKRIDAALKGMRDLEIIRELKGNQAALQGVVKWILDNGHDKLYQTCNDKSSDGCIGFGLRESFHGKKCPACRREARNQNYAAKHSKKKRSVSFKKGTKKK